MRNRKKIFSSWPSVFIISLSFLKNRVFFPFLAFAWESFDFWLLYDSFFFCSHTGTFDFLSNSHILSNSLSSYVLMEQSSKSSSCQSPHTVCQNTNWTFHFRTHAWNTEPPLCNSTAYFLMNYIQKKNQWTWHKPKALCNRTNLTRWSLYAVGGEFLFMTCGRLCPVLRVLHLWMRPDWWVPHLSLRLDFLIFTLCLCVF